MSFAEMTATPLRKLSSAPTLGLGTMLQAAPRGGVGVGVGGGPASEPPAALALFPPAPNPATNTNRHTAMAAHAHHQYLKARLLGSTAMFFLPLSDCVRIHRLP